MYENSDINKPLVSIVTPCYNSENYIFETIESVINQTYSNWEMIIVDDISIDNSIEIIKKYCEKDSRIKYYILEEKGGASLARNKAIRESKGKYIAFLDSDDLWKEEKLEKQVKFMEENNYDFTYHNYELINENSKKINRMRIAPQSITYKRALIGCSIGCLTAMYNCESIGKVQIKRLDKRNDDALWFKILEKAKIGYLLEDNIAYYRIGNNSISSGSKVKLLKYHYMLYRNAQEFSILKSLFFTCTNIIIYFWNKRSEIDI
ncbi:MAG: glycosyltransferase [Erysipelotrichales bacterium]|nr:glycosyltransferase [Erysipelotrichales bacterium]